MGFKRFCFAVAGAIILTTAGFPSQSFAFRGHPGPFIPVPGVVVGIPLPPPVIIPSPPELVVVPRTNVSTKDLPVSPSSARSLLLSVLKDVTNPPAIRLALFSYKYGN